MTKRWISLLLVCALSLCLIVPAAAGAATPLVSDLTATGVRGSGTLTVSGTTQDIPAAVIVQILDGEGSIIGMESLLVMDDAFSGSVSYDAASTPVKVRAANYDGGAWTTQDVELTDPPTPGPTYAVLTFSTDGGSTLERVRAISGSTVDLTAYVPEKEGFVFAGWYADAALTESITSVRLVKNTTVYAAWEAEKTPCPGDDTCTLLERFTDVDPDDWYHDGLHYCVENSIMDGKPGSVFDPDGHTSRAMLVIMLHRLEGEPVVNYAMNFSDVEDGCWYTEAIRWAASEKIVSGYDDGTFLPDQDITREELAALLYNYVRYKGEGFTGDWMFPLGYADAAEISDWAYEAVCWMSMKGIVGGKPGNVFDPGGYALRSEAAVLFRNFCENR